MLPYVQGLNNLGDGTKKAIGLSIAGGSAFAEYGGKAVELAAYAKVAGVSVTSVKAAMVGARTATLAFAASTAGLTLGVLAAVGGMVLITKSVDDYSKALISAEQAEQNLLATQSKAVIATKDRIASINKTVEALQAEYAVIEDLAAKRVTITKDILQKEIAADAAREAGDSKRAGQLQSEADSLKRTRKEFDTTANEVVKSEEKKTKAVEASAKASQEAAKKYQEGAAERAATEKAATEKLKAELDKRLAFQAELLSKEAALRKSAKDLERQESDSALVGLQSKLAAGEDVQAQIEREIEKRGRAIQAIAAEEAAIAKLNAKKSADTAIKENPEAKSQILQQLAEEERQINQQTALKKIEAERAAQEQVKKVKEEVAKKDAEYAAKLASIAAARAEQERAGIETTFELRRQKLDEEAALGIDVGQKRINLEKEILAFQKNATEEKTAFEIDQIKKVRDAANVGATKDQVAINNAQAELDIVKATRVEREALKALADTELSKEQAKTAEIQKQLDALKDQTKEKQKQAGFDTSFGGLSGIEDINKFGGGFGQSRTPKPEDNAGPTEAELELKLKRQKIAEIQAAEATGKKTTTGGTTGSDLTNQINSAARGSDPAALQLQQQTNTLLTQVVTSNQQIAQQLAQANKQQTTPPLNFGQTLVRGAENTLK